MIDFLIDLLCVAWVIAVVIYIIFRIQWYRGKITIKYEDSK